MGLLSFEQCLHQISNVSQIRVLVDDNEFKHRKFLLSSLFTQLASASLGLKNKLNLGKTLVAVRNTRKISKKDMVWNDALPRIEVDPETYSVKADGVLLRCEPAKVLPLAQRYYLF